MSHEPRTRVCEACGYTVEECICDFDEEDEDSAEFDDDELGVDPDDPELELGPQLLVVDFAIAGF